MKIIRKAVAGTLESSDALVEVSPGTGVALEIESAVLAQFDVSGAAVRVTDRGALDCTIRARVETALKRGAKEEAK